MSIENEQRYCLQIDVGNSSAKWRFVRLGHSSEVIARGRLLSDDQAAQVAGMALPMRPQAIWISSVASEERESALAAELFTHWGVDAWFARTQAQTLDLQNSYLEPERMGVDRWLAMLGARARCKGRLCVVDVGSALTIDVVAQDGKHEGGYIIPGSELMERALLLDTDRVRFTEEVAYGLEPGQSTAQAVRHGIALAQVGAVAEVMRTETADCRFFFCGGAAETLLNLLSQASQRGREVPLNTVDDLIFDGLEILANSSCQ